MHASTIDLEPRIAAPEADERRLSVAIVDEELPYPAITGKRIRTLNLTLRLARRHRIKRAVNPIRPRSFRVHANYLDALNTSHVRIHR